MVRSSWCAGTPRPTESAPCGSKSTSSTGDRTRPGWPQVDRGRGLATPPSVRHGDDPAGPWKLSGAVRERRRRRPTTYSSGASRSSSGRRPRIHRPGVDMHAPVVLLASREVRLVQSHRCSDVPLQRTQGKRPPDTTNNASRVVAMSFASFVVRASPTEAQPSALGCARVYTSRSESRDQRVHLGGRHRRVAQQLLTPARRAASAGGLATSGAGCAGYRLGDPAARRPCAALQALCGQPPPGRSGTAPGFPALLGQTRPGAHR